MNVPGVSGLFGHGDPQAPKDVLAKMLESVTDDPALVSTCSDDRVAVGAIQGSCLAHGSVVCAVAGNIDWLTVEISDIQLKQGPAFALHEAYRQHGTHLLDRIGGRFALFLSDRDSGFVMLAGDRLGQMPVYWGRRGDHSLVFAQTATAVAQQLSDGPEVSPQAIYNYLYFHMVPAPGTVFKGVHKLRAGHVLLREGSEWLSKRYWVPPFDEHADAPMPEAAEEMKRLLSTSVARLAAGHDCGAFLSGGLDSSTVAGLLAKHSPHPRTYSIGFDAEGYDEIAYAKIASKRFGTDFRSYYVTPEDVLSALPKIAAAYDEPFGNSSALPAYFCARFAAEDGRQRLLAGDGGDELFAGNERYAKQTVFERYALAPRWFRHLLMEPLVASRFADHLPKINKVRSYIQQANVPLPDRLQTYNFMNRLGVDRVISEDLGQAVDRDEPARLERTLYDAPRGASRLNRMLYLDWHHTLADNDLRKVNRMCQLAGIEVEYPMLDDRLVAFSCRVSSSRKMRHNRLRDFYKQAFRDFLPQEIIDKPKHGFGLPFGVWMAEHKGLQELAGDSLTDIRSRNIVRGELIDDLLRLHTDSHAGYYGELIWILTMLELWLSNQGKGRIAL